MDSSRFGSESGACYIPILKNFEDSIVLGQAYFDHYYTVFDQTSITENKFYTNQIAFGLANKKDYGLEGETKPMNYRRGDLTFQQFKDIKELERVVDHPNLPLVSIICSISFIVMLLACILLVFKNLSRKHGDQHAPGMEEALTA